MERNQIVKAAKELNIVLGLNPPINATWEKRKLERAIEDAVALLQEDDKLTTETLHILEFIQNGNS